MPRYRKLHVKTLESLDIHDMNDDFVRLMWVLLPLGLDAEGRGIMSAAWIRAKIFPLRDDIEDKRIKEAMNIFEQYGMIIRYTYNGRPIVYFQVVNWHEYQGDTSRESASYLPDPNDDASTILGTKSRPSHDKVENSSGLNTNTNTNTNTDALTPQGDVVDDDVIDDDPKGGLLLSKTGAGRVLIDALMPDAEAKGRDAPKYFGSYQQREAFVEYYEKLGHDDFEELVDEAIRRERLSRPAILNFLRVAVSRRGKDDRQRERVAKKRKSSAEETLAQLNAMKEQSQ